MSQLSLADRATIANMSPEYGATMGFFPVDRVTLDYLKLTGRSDETVSLPAPQCAHTHLKTYRHILLLFVFPNKDLHVDYDSLHPFFLNYRCL